MESSQGSVLALITSAVHVSTNMPSTKDHKQIVDDYLAQ